MNAFRKTVKTLATLPNLWSEQVLRTCCDGDPKTLNTVLRRLKSSGLATTSIVMMRHRIDAKKPIARISSEEHLFTSERIAYQGRLRWENELKPTLIIQATLKLHAHFGGNPQRVAPVNISDDIALAGILIQKSEANPGFHWELVRSKPGGGAQPDASTSDGFLELVGQYTGAMIQAKKGSGAAAYSIEFW
jgi:hypothetical protein